MISTRLLQPRNLLFIAAIAIVVHMVITPVRNTVDSAQ